MIATHLHAGTEGRLPTSELLQTVRADLSTPDGVATLLHEFERDGVRVSGLVHAAAIVDHTEWDTLDGARFSEVLRVNVTAAFELAVGLVRSAGLESVVLFSSIASDFPHLGSIAYTTSKGAIDALTRALAVALSPARVNAIAPGIVRSHRTAGDSSFAAGDTIAPDALGELVVHLLGPGSRGMTGQVLRVDGGRTLRLS